MKVLEESTFTLKRLELKLLLSRREHGHDHGRRMLAVVVGVHLSPVSHRWGQQFPYRVYRPGNLSSRSMLDRLSLALPPTHFDHDVKHIR